MAGRSRRRPGTLGPRRRPTSSSSPQTAPSASTTSGTNPPGSVVLPLHFDMNSLAYRLRLTSDFDSTQKSWWFLPICIKFYWCITININISIACLQGQVILNQFKLTEKVARLRNNPDKPEAVLQLCELYNNTFLLNSTEGINAFIILSLFSLIIFS